MYYEKLIIKEVLLVTGKNITITYDFIFSLMIRLINGWNLSATHVLLILNSNPISNHLKTPSPGFNDSTTKKGQKLNSTVKTITYFSENRKSHMRLEHIGQKKNAYLKAAEENSLKVWTEHWGSYFS